MSGLSSILPSGEITSSSENESAPAGVASIEVGSAAWSLFTSAASEESFCSAWLALQCGMIARTRAGLLLLRNSAGAYVPAAIWPDVRHDVTYLAPIAETALGQGRSVVLGLTASEEPSVRAGSLYVAYPIESDAQLQGVVVLDMAARSEAQVESVFRQLLWGAGWLIALLRRQLLTRNRQLLNRVSTALTLVQAAQEHATLNQAAMAVVNELATTVKVDRVSLGIVRKGLLKLEAISRTAWFDRKTQLVELIENAMDEALDQQASIVHPPNEAVRGKVSVAQRDLAVHAGALSVLTVPLRSGGRGIGAMTLERTEGAPFDADLIGVCEASGELLGPGMEARLEGERWLCGRLIEKPLEWLRKLTGPRRPMLKLATMAALLAAIFLASVDGDFRVSARTVVEGQIQRAAVAPFDGYIAEAFVRAGDTVKQGAVLAALDDRDLKLERIKWEAEKEQSVRKYQEALAKHDRAAARILAAQREQVEAQLALVEEKLVRTQIIAPFHAVVVSGDLSQTLGAPVERGKVLFELAPLDSYRVVLNVDERDIAYVAAGQRGELGLTGITERTLPFTLKSVTSVATAEEGRNFFRVEAQLEDVPERLRPGMEGVGKVSIGERRLTWIWTRNFVGWLRIAFWSWLP